MARPANFKTLPAAERSAIYRAEYRARGGSPAITARRNANAERQGWASYSQARRWTEKRHLPLGPMREWSEAQLQTVRDLAARCCGDDHEKAREGSLFCRHCTHRVNPRGPDGSTRTSQRAGTWQVRLVRVVETVERRRRAARLGVARKRQRAVA